MHVMRHHHPGTEFIEVSLDFSDQNGPSHQIRDAMVLEPGWPRTMPIQSPGLSHKCLADSGNATDAA